MSIRRPNFIRSLVGAAIALVFAAAPALAAAPSSPAPAACLLTPGVYGITDSSGGLVGIPIVYPDCRMEVVKRPEIT
ncbi:hypothetical protein [Longimicrobium sp.]|uniref:hypothetical protein n=1 Tax=Longimicrobium sp. TaxID=2029185 RepID=UPI003B3A9612